MTSAENKNDGKKIDTVPAESLDPQLKRGYSPYFNRTFAYEIYYYGIYFYEIYFYSSILL
jgi:hypothetical protein